MGDLHHLLDKSIGLRVQTRLSGQEPRDYTIQGITYVGRSVIFDLGEFVYKISRRDLELDIQLGEFSLRLMKPTGEPAYGLSVLNQKLSSMVGNRDFYQLIPPYDQLIEEVIDSLIRFGGTETDFNVLNAMGAITLSQATRRRLAILRQSENHELVIRATKAVNVLDSLVDRITPVNKEPVMELHDNPLIIWAGAKLCDFILRSEIDSVAHYLRNTYNIRDEMFAQCGAVCAALEVIRHKSADVFLDFVVRLTNANGSVRVSELEAFRDAFERGGGRYSIFNLLDRSFFTDAAPHLHEWIKLH
jgi:hypothetical protein